MKDVYMRYLWKIVLGAALTLALLNLAGCTKPGFKAKMVTKTSLGQPNFRTDLPETLTIAHHEIKSSEPKRANRLIDRWIKKMRRQKKKVEDAKQRYNEYIDHALYFLGMARFDRGRYYHAWEAYEELVKDHSASPLFPYALYRQVEIAEKLLEGEKRIVWGFLPLPAYTEGEEILENVAERWPGSELAGNALMMLADFHNYQERYLEAQLGYQILVDNYQNTAFYEPALRKNAETTHAQYQGSPYDTNCLREALIRYQQYQLSYPEKAEQIGVARRIELIRNQMALKDFEIADFYYRTHKLDAARYYWQRIAAKYQDTDWASRSIALLEQTE